MRRPLGLLIFGGILVWACIMAVHAYADEPQKAPEHWKIVIGITDPEQGDVKLTYGNHETGAVYYGSEADCKKAITGERKFLDGLKAVLAYAKKRHAEVDKPICVLEVKPSEL